MSDHAKPSATVASQLPLDHDQLAKGLGWFSVGRGLIELFAAGRLCRALGLGNHESLVQACGVREVATGVAILASRDPTPWIWGRLAGDALDLATLATAGQRAAGRQRQNLSFAVAAVAAVTALDVVCAGRGSPTIEDQGEGGRPGYRDGSPKIRLRVIEIRMGRIVLQDQPTGHEFRFQVETRGGRQSLGAFAPRWANGQEPTSSNRYVIEARDHAEREAADQGWIGT